MDPATLSLTAASALTMLQPYLPALAKAAAKKIGEELPSAVVILWQKITTHFEGKPDDEKTLNYLLNHPDDPDVQGAFRLQLKLALAEDDAFAEQVQKLLKDTQSNATYHGEVRGSGTLVQGSQNKVVGAGGVMIGGDSKGNVNAGHDKD